VSVVLENLDLYFEALRTTAALALLSFAVAFTIGIVLAACRVSPVRPLRVAAATYVELVRNTPLTVLFVLFWFGFPSIGIRYEPFPSAVIVLSAYTGAFMGETIRAGINTVAVGQAEAARALGLTFTQVLGLVVLPQALRAVVAPIGSLFIALTKNTSIAFIISVPEIASVAYSLSNRTGQPIPVYLGAAAAYLLLTLPSGLVFGALERRVAIKR
jgi:glutamate transport system permease protein